MAQFILFDKRHGRILADIECGKSEARHYKRDDVDYMEGRWDHDEFYIKDGVALRRKVVNDAPVYPTCVEVGPENYIVIKNLRPGAWIRVRPNGRMNYEEQTKQAIDGTITVWARVPGTYVAEYVGEYGAPEFSWEVVSLEALKQRRNDEINAKKAEVLSGGFLHAERRWDGDDKAQNNINSSLLAANIGILPEGFFWTDYDNVDVPVTSAELIALGQAMMAFNFGAHAKARSLKQTIDQSTSFEEVLNLDIEEGWPT